MFLIPMCWIVSTGLIQVFTFVPVEGEVSEFLAPDPFAQAEEHRGGWIRYRYSVEGIPYQGTCPPAYSFGMPRQPFAQHAMDLEAGDSIRVFHDPGDPSVSTLEPRVEATAFMFITFTLPFLLLGWLTFSQPEALRLQDAGGGMMLAGGNISFVTYALLSAVGSFAFGFAALQSSDWKTATLIGALLPSVIIPGTVILLRRWVDRANAEPSDRKLPSDEDSASRAEKAGVKKQVVVWMCVTLFWCGITGLFATDVFIYWVELAQGKNYVQTGGEIIRSKIHVSSSSDGTSYTVLVEYGYKVGDEAYVSDRITFGRMKVGLSRKRANEQIGQFPTGEQVPVFYDPEDPQQAVLIRNVSPMRIWLTVFITPFVLIGGYMIWNTLGLLMGKNTIKLLQDENVRDDIHTTSG